MSPDDRWRVQHMIDAAEQALGFVQGRNREDLDRDVMLRMARALQHRLGARFDAGQPLLLPGVAPLG